MNNSSGVEVSSERLFNLVLEAIDIHKGYDKNSNFQFYDEWNWKKLRFEEKKCFDYPSWAYPYSGTLNRLLELKKIAEGLEPKDRVFVSELTFLNLMFLIDKSEKFQKDVFVMRY